MRVVRVLYVSKHVMDQSHYTLLPEWRHMLFRGILQWLPALYSGAKKKKKRLASLKQVLVDKHNILCSCNIHLGSPISL